jgi:hypothetical protein
MPDQDNLRDKLRQEGLVWLIEPSEYDWGSRPDEVYDVSNLVDELDDEEQGLQYYLGKKDFVPSAAFPDRISAIPADSITVTCDSNSGLFAAPVVDTNLVTLGKRCYIDQLRNDLTNHKLERKPDITSTGRKTYGPWFAGYIKPGGTFHMALMIQGKGNDNDDDEWGYTTPGDSESDKVFAECDATDGTFIPNGSYDDGNGAQISSPVQFAATSYKPLKKCSTQIQTNTDANKAYNLLDAKGLKTADGTGPRIGFRASVTDADGNVVKFVDAGSETDWSNYVDASDDTLKLYSPDTGFIKLVCSDDRSKPGEFTEVKIDRSSGNQGKLGQYCFIGDGTVAPNGALGITANNQHLANMNLTALSTALIKLHPEVSGVDIMLDIATSAIQIEGAPGWKLNETGTLLNVDCAQEDGTISNGTLIPADHIGQICDKNDASLAAALLVEGLEIDPAEMANVALNTDPEAPLDLGTSLTAVADGTAAADYHYDDTGSLASDIQAMCNKTDGTFTLDTAGITAIKARADANGVNALGKKCNLWGTDGMVTPGGNLKNAVESYGVAGNDNKPVMLLESDDFRAYWITPDAKTPDLDSPVSWMWDGSVYSEDFSSGSADTSRNPGATVSLGNMIKANPETHQYLCASETSCASGGLRAFMEYGTSSTGYKNWLHATGLPYFPPSNACAKSGTPINDPGRQCHKDNVVFACNGASGNFEYLSHDASQLVPLQSCSTDDLMVIDSQGNPITDPTIEQTFGIAGVKSVAADLSALGGTTVAPGGKLDLGTKLEALNDNRYYSAGSSDADASLLCNGKTGKFESLVFAAGKEMQRTCDSSSGDLDQALAAKGLKKKADYARTEKKPPGSTMKVGDLVEADLDSHNDDYTGGADDDVTVICDGSTGKFVSPQVKTGIAAPTPQTGVATVLQTSVNFSIIAKCQVGVAAENCVAFSQMDSFKMMFEDALRGSIDAGDMDSVRDVSVQNIDLAAEKTMRRLLAEAIDDPKRRLQESSIRGLKVDYNIYLEPNVADKTVQSIIEQVAPSSAGGNTKAELHRVKLEREIEAGLGELARAENARGKADEIARVYSLAGINSFNRVQTNFIDASELAQHTANSDGGRGGSYGSYGSGMSTRDDMAANSAFSTKSSALMSVLMAFFLLAMSGMWYEQ